MANLTGKLMADFPGNTMANWTDAVAGNSIGISADLSADISAGILTDTSAGQHGRAGAVLGNVAGLYLRRARDAAPHAVPQVVAHAGEGLDGDSARGPLSPRQLLVAGTPAYRRLDLPANALRENLLLDIDSATLRSGQLLALGADAVLQLTFACEPCARLNMRQDRLARSIGAQRGMLARVLAGGLVRVGDPVRLLPHTMPAWPDDWRGRVEAVLARVPDGMVVDYRQLALLAGVALAYCRVFPRVARELGVTQRAVPLRSSSLLPRWDGAGLFDRTDPPAWPDAGRAAHQAGCASSKV